MAIHSRRILLQRSKRAVGDLTTNERLHLVRNLIAQTRPRRVSTDSLRAANRQHGNAEQVSDDDELGFGCGVVMGDCL
jgi:hypothetical protein